MRRYWAYLKKLSEHKFYVFLEACKLGIPWLGFIHDWSKFLPCEFIPYARSFYNSDGSLRQIRDESGYYNIGSIGEAFDHAWLHHQHWNKHHWQHYLLVQDQDDNKVLIMPMKYAREMLADWRGASRAYGTNDAKSWYMANGERMHLHPLIRGWIEKHLGVSNVQPDNSEDYHAMDERQAA